MSRLRGLGALIRAYLIETWRSKPALFWNLFFPLLTLVGFSYIFGAGEAIPVARGLPGIMTINLLAASFFGVSLHMVSLRERELYRRFWVTPLRSLTVVLAHSVTALVNISISIILQLAVAKLWFHIHIQGSIAALALAFLLAAFAFIPLGLIVGSVAQDMKTAPAISNLLFFPLTFLSGAAMPLYFMPAWIQRLAEFLPSTYVVELLQGVILRGNSFRELWHAVGLLLLTGVMGFAFNALLFRWESQQPINRRGLALAAASLIVIYAVPYARNIRLESARPPTNQSAAQGNNQGSQATTRKLSASARILKGMTILDGSGGRIERGQIVLDGNRIVEVGPASDDLPKGVPVTDLSGLYVIPGLIDSHIHLGGSAGGSIGAEEYVPSRQVHDTQVYLALGITSFVSLTDHVEDMQRLRKEVASGNMRAPRTYLSGPGITAPGGHPARLFVSLPGFAEYMTRQVTTEDEAVDAVRELKDLRVDIVKLFLEEGWAGEPLPVLAEPALRAAIRTAGEENLLTTVHVDNDRHARLAIDAGSRGIEHIPPDLSDETIRALVSKGVTLTPTLVEAEALRNAMNGVEVTDPLVLQWVQPAVLNSLKSPDSWIAKLRQSSPDAVRHYTERYEQARASLRRAVAGGVTIIAGSDAGNEGVFHGPGLIRELELLVDVGGMTPMAAIVSATGAAARRLGTQEIGRIAPGAFADLVVLGADPARDIRAVRDVRWVYFGGVSLQRDALLNTSPGNWRPLLSWPTTPTKRRK
jgi:imidazolonepropionase-like amidohydrolase/ABC-type multidrug transport system permease subunit